MRFHAETIGDDLQRVTLVGRLDAAGADLIETGFTGLVSAGGRSVVLDMSGVSFLGSLGIRLILSNARVLQRRGRKLVICRAQAQAMDVFATVDLGTLIPIVETEADAMALLTVP